MQQLMKKEAMILKEGYMGEFGGEVKMMWLCYDLKKLNNFKIRIYRIGTGEIMSKNDWLVPYHVPL